MGKPFLVVAFLVNVGCSHHPTSAYPELPEVAEREIVGITVTSVAVSLTSWVALPLAYEGHFALARRVANGGHRCRYRKCRD